MVDCCKWFIYLWLSFFVYKKLSGHIFTFRERIDRLSFNSFVTFNVGAFLIMMCLFAAVLLLEMSNKLLDFSKETLKI